MEKAYMGAKKHLDEISYPNHVATILSDSFIICCAFNRNDNYWWNHFIFYR